MGVRLAWFHCFSGVAGDMTLGSLLDAGADLDEVKGLLERLPVGGWDLTADPVLRCGLAGIKAHGSGPRWTHNIGRQAASSR